MMILQVLISVSYILSVLVVFCGDRSGLRLHFSGEGRDPLFSPQRDFVHGAGLLQCSVVDVGL